MGRLVVGNHHPQTWAAPSHEGGGAGAAANMDKSVRPYRRIKCARKGCGKCLFCLKISAVCQCSPEEKKKEPRDVMYGWCVKCRSKHAEDYKKVVGVQCTYCGADTEDNFTPCGIAIAILCFPIGLCVCCFLKERKCVVCDRAVIG